MAFSNASSHHHSFIVIISEHSAPPSAWSAARAAAVNSSLLRSIYFGRGEIVSSSNIQHICSLDKLERSRHRL